MKLFHRLLVAAALAFFLLYGLELVSFLSVVGGDAANWQYQLVYQGGGLPTIAIVVAGTGVIILGLVAVVGAALALGLCFARASEPEQVQFFGLFS